MLRRLLLLCCLTSLGTCVLAQIRCFGTVTDTTGVPLVRARISVSDTDRWTLSDSKGRFTIKIPSDKHVLNIHYFGYEPKSVVAEDLQLRPSIPLVYGITLPVIIIIGYQPIACFKSNDYVSPITRLPLQRVKSLTKPTGKLSLAD